MQTIVVVSDPRDWPLGASSVPTVAARDYLTDPAWTKARNVRVYNLCRSYRYQSAGYYVSLLAAARKHRPFPSLLTVLDMKSRAIVRTAADELDELIQQTLATIKSDRFTLSVYFGRNLAKRYDRIALRLFNLFPAPLLRAQFARNGRWQLTSIAPISARDVPTQHREFLLDSAQSYFSKPRFSTRPSRTARFDLAILQDPNERLAPSNAKALRRFESAAEKAGFGVELIDRDDYSRIGEFDALFIRETTYVNHHTFRFAQRAAADGLVVIDDPQSILRCTNKVYLAEALEAHRVPIPRTLVVDRVALEEVERQIRFPCILKHPDSAFSQGVIKCKDPEEFERHAAEILQRSDLFIVQEFMPSEFDWRIGIFDGEPLYACRYYMASGHWQIVSHEPGKSARYGRVDTQPVEIVPRRVVSVAKRAAAVIGDGLYGVDVKEVDKRVVVIEVNDNPTIDSGVEDGVIKEALYRRIMEGMLRRVEAAKSSR